MRWLMLSGILVASILAGCENHSGNHIPALPSPKVPLGDENQVVFKQEGVKEGKAPAEGNKPAQAKNGDQPDKPIQRKIIYTGRVELSVEKFDKAETDLTALIKSVNGYIANADDSGSPGAVRSGTYTIRVPVEQFETFLDAVTKIGELRRCSRDSQDITDQYYDTEAHMKNDQVREQGLQKLYDKTADKGKIEDLLAVDRELSNVRGRIEEQQGRLKRWDKETSYSTVIVKMEQRKEYDPAGTPGFGTTLSRTWEGSLDALLTFGKGLVIFVVAVTPWLAVFLLVMSPLWYRVWRRFSKPRTPTPPPTPPTTEATATVVPA